MKPRWVTAPSPVPAAPEQPRRVSMRVREFAATVGATEKSLYGMIVRGQLRAVRIGRSLYIPISELERFQ